MNDTTGATNKPTADTVDKSALSAEGQTYPVPTEIPPTHPIEKLVENYLLAIRNIAQTVNIVMPHLAKWRRDEIKKYEKRLAHFIPEDANDGVTHQVTFDSARDFVELSATLRTLEELDNNKALPVLARSLFMQMFSEFDAFMGALLKIFILKIKIY